MDEKGIKAIRRERQVKRTNPQASSRSSKFLGKHGALGSCKGPISLPSALVGSGLTWPREEAGEMMAVAGQVETQPPPPVNLHLNGHSPFF